MENKITNLRKEIAELYLKKAQLGIQKINIETEIKNNYKNKLLSGINSQLDMRKNIYNALRSIVLEIAHRENQLSELEEVNDIKFLKNGGKKSIKK